jgi:hypothetical protein
MYYLRSAKQGHPDGANNSGFCFEQGRCVEQNEPDDRPSFDEIVDCFGLMPFKVIQNVNSAKHREANNPLTHSSAASI